MSKLLLIDEKGCAVGYISVDSAFMYRENDTPYLHVYSTGGLEYKIYIKTNGNAEKDISCCLQSMIGVNHRGSAGVSIIHVKEMRKVQS